MRKIALLSICIAAFTLPACTHILKPYRAPVQQGNIISDDDAQKIKIGMRKSQVTDILGEPLLINPFDNNTWTYVYALRPSRGPVQEKRLILRFTNNQVSSKTIDLPAPKDAKLKRR